MQWLTNLQEKAQEKYARFIVDKTVGASMDRRAKGSTAKDSIESIEDLKKVCHEYPEFAGPVIDEIATIALEKHKENIAIFTSARRGLLDFLWKKDQPETTEKAYAALEKLTAEEAKCPWGQDMAIGDIADFIRDREARMRPYDRAFRVLERIGTEKVVERVGRMTNSSTERSEMRALEALKALSANPELEAAVVKAVAEMVGSFPYKVKNNHHLQKKEYAEKILLAIGSDDAMELLAKYSYPSSYPADSVDWGDDSLRTVDRTVELYEVLVEQANEGRKVGMCIPMGEGTKGLMKAVIPAVDQLLTPVFLAERGKEYQEQAEISLGRLNDTPLWGHCGGRRDHGDLRGRFNKAMEGVAAVELAQNVIQLHTQTVAVIHEQGL